MGSNISCCKANTPRIERKYNYQRKERYNNHLLIKEEDSCFNLQHISEREADDPETDPSTHPTVGPLFMQRSRSDIRADLKDKRKSVLNLLDSRPLKKSSSCSTIYLDDSTVSHPDIRNTIKCVALAIYYHIKHRPSNLVIDIFDERYHPLTKDRVNEDDLREPDHESIYLFIRSLFISAQLPPECAIITLVYLERLLTYAEIEIVPATWKRIVLGAILLASKVWDDQAVWNVDYCQILEDISVEDMNELERHFLELLQFNINVPSSVYTKYYFELRTLADQNDFAFQIKPLSKERAQKLEAMSKALDEKLILDLQRNGFRKWSSVESVLISPKRRSKAIIS